LGLLGKRSFQHVDPASPPRRARGRRSSAGRHYRGELDLAGREPPAVEGRRREKGGRGRERKRWGRMEAGRRGPGGGKKEGRRGRIKQI